MANTAYDFAGQNGRTIAFDPATDTLNFGAGLSAALLALGLASTLDGVPTLVVSHGDLSVTLTGLTLSMLRNGAFVFADGGVFVVGDGLAGTAADEAANTINGTAARDQLVGLGELRHAEGRWRIRHA